MAGTISALHHTRVTPESFTHRSLHAVEHNYVWIRIIQTLHARNSCPVMQLHSHNRRAVILFKTFRRMLPPV